MNNRDVFVSDSIILANIFVVEQGDSICVD